MNKNDYCDATNCRTHSEQTRTSITVTTYATVRPFCLQSLYP